LTAATMLPGFQPLPTKDYFTRAPKGVIFGDELIKTDIQVYCYIMENSGPDQPYAATNQETADALGLSIGSVNRSLGRLRKLRPPGVNHPYIDVRGGTRGRQIYARYLPLETKDPRPGIRINRARNIMHSARAPDSNQSAISEPGQGLASTLLFERIEEKTNVNVSSILGNAPSHAHEGENPGTIAIPTPPEPLSPPVDGVDVELAGLTADQLRERIAGLAGAAESPHPMIRIDARLKRAAARDMLEALESPGEPIPAPKVGSIVPKPSLPAAPAPRPSILTLVGRLRRVAGPEPIETLARRLSEDLRDPGSIGFYRQVGEGVRQGRIRAEDVLAAHRQARSATARSPGAIFTAFIRRLE
jgi:hypothetical protein